MTLVIFLFLTSRLEPEEFGIFALALVFVEFLQRELRFSMIDAVIQQQKLDDRSLSTSFWVSAIIVSVLCVVIIAASPAIGRAFQSDKLSPVLAMLALTVLPIPFSIGPMALLNAKMNFRSLSLRPILGVMFSSIAALIVVFSDYPEWALVVQRAVLICTETIFLQFAEPVIPKLKFDKVWAKKFLRVSLEIFSAQTIARWILRVFDVLVTAIFGPAATGLWRIAERIVSAVTNIIARPLNSLWVISLSRENTSKAEKRKFFLDMTQLNAVLMVPTFAGISIISDDFVTAFLRDEYSGVTKYLSIYAGFGVLAPLYFHRNAALIAFKKTGLLNVLSLLDLAILILLAYLLSSSGETALVVSLGLTHALSIIPSLAFFLKDTRASIWDVIHRVIPAYIALLAMVIACIGVSILLADTAPTIRLFALSICGGFVYIGTLWFGFRKYVFDIRKLLAP